MNNSPDLFIGIMSGTSLDGVDAVLADLSQATPRLLASHYQPYPEPLKEALLALHQVSGNELHQSHLIANRLAREYADATLALLKKAGVNAAQVQAIGCHGQTVRHRPEHGYTVQLGNGALLAELTGIHVVGDFRSRDIAAGGQGAPLVPAFHDHVLRHPDVHRVILNIGGIANITDLAPGKTTTGFDTGPGNLLMDAWIARHQGKPYDKDGAWARSGKAIPALLQRLLAEPYFSAAPPKSTGRDLFDLEWLQQHLNGDESPKDVQLTLLALTGESIAVALRKHCPGTQELYLCGGGAHNIALVSYLRGALPQCRVMKTDELGIAADWMEAIAFAWLAQQTMHLMPGNLPAVTGAKHPCVLGAIYPA
ncbi:MAG: anhydro-N-acetylmuramic acid kinase [Gammaproteobacteria bacterium]|nr:anhydro-N-acetylmuramic acid kinase [Gammaproteobacteria bacterium]MBU1969480.1 anhydro-N-acetylmuramic acid kinase [Gammaproteobacteria bacterium]